MKTILILLISVISFTMALSQKVDLKLTQVAPGIYRHYETLVLGDSTIQTPKYPLMDSLEYKKFIYNELFRLEQMRTQRIAEFFILEQKVAQIRSEYNKQFKDKELESVFAEATVDGLQGTWSLEKKEGETTTSWNVTIKGLDVKDKKKTGKITGAARDAVTITGWETKPFTLIRVGAGFEAKFDSTIITLTR